MFNLFLDNLFILKLKILFEKLLILTIFILPFSIAFDISINNLILKIMLFLWLFTIDFKNLKYTIKNSKILITILLFIIWIFLSCVFIFYINSKFEMILKYFLLPILVISTTIKKEQIKYIITAYMLGMFINEIVSYGIYFEFIKNNFLGFDIVGNKSNPIPFITSHMEYTLFLSLSILISIFSFFRIEHKLIKLMLAIFIITMTINIFLTTGRTGQFTLLITLIILLIIYFRHSYKKIFFGFSIVLITYTIAFLFSENVNKRFTEGYLNIVNVIEKNDYNTSWGVRLSSYVIIPKIIEHEEFNLFYGTGLSRLDNVIYQIHLTKFGKESIFKYQNGHLHNSYITIFAGTGIIGLILFILIWFYIFKIKIEDNYLNYIRYSFLFIFFFGGFSDNLYRQKEVMILFAIFISIIIVSSILKKEDEIEF